MAKILYDSGVIVLASFISPYKKDRDNIRKLFPSTDFIEIHVDAKIETVQSRDPKGLYKKAKREIPNFTGISSDYEIPDKPEIRLDTDVLSAEESLNIVMEFLKEKMASETNTRSLLKAISWRIIASIVTTVIAYSFGLPAKAIGLVFFADLIIKFILYYFHERVWVLYIKYGTSSDSNKEKNDF